MRLPYTTASNYLHNPNNLTNKMHGGVQAAKT